MPLNHSSQYAELTEQQLAFIGRLVIEWSNIEYLLGVLLSRLLFTPEFLGRVYRDEMSAARLQASLSKAVEFHKQRYRAEIISAETLDEIVELNRDIEKYRGLRNKFSHFCWTRSSDDEIFGTRFSGAMTSKKNDAKEWKKFSIAELEGTCQVAYQLVERLLRIIEMIPDVDEEQAATEAKAAMKDIEQGTIID